MALGSGDLVGTGGFKFTVGSLSPSGDSWCMERVGIHHYPAGSYRYTLAGGSESTVRPPTHRIPGMDSGHST